MNKRANKTISLERQIINSAMSYWNNFRLLNRKQMTNIFLLSCCVSAPIQQDYHTVFTCHIQNWSHNMLQTENCIQFLEKKNIFFYLGRYTQINTWIFSEFSFSYKNIPNLRKIESIKTTAKHKSIFFGYVLSALKFFTITLWNIVMNLASLYCKYIQRALNCTVVFRDEASGEGTERSSPPPPRTLPNFVQIHSHSVNITWSFGITRW